jgi:hypothetical protein
LHQQVGLFSIGIPGPLFCKVNLPQEAPGMLSQLSGFGIGFGHFGHYGTDPFEAGTL